MLCQSGASLGVLTCCLGSSLPSSLELLTGLKMMVGHQRRKPSISMWTRPCRARPQIHPCQVPECPHPHAPTLPGIWVQRLQATGASWFRQLSVSGEIVGHKRVNVSCGSGEAVIPRVGGEVVCVVKAWEAGLLASLHGSDSHCDLGQVTVKQYHECRATSLHPRDHEA